MMTFRLEKDFKINGKKVFLLVAQFQGRLKSSPGEKP